MTRLRGMTVVLFALAALVIAPAAASALPAPVHLRYGPHEEQFLTVFGQEGPGHINVILTHEGGWHQQMRETELEGPALLLQKQGFTVYSLNWEQDDFTTAFPLEPEQIREGVLWVKAHAAPYGGGGKIEMMGGSAGGHLAAITAELVNKEKPGTISAVASLSGPMNLSTLAEEVEAGEIYVGLTKSLRRALGCRFGATCSAEFANEWSPVDNVDAATCPPFWLAGAEIEMVPIEEQYEMAAALEAAGCPVTLRVVPRNHAFAYWAKVSFETVAFLRSPVSFTAAHAFSRTP
jgi:acetyl esterase/lipase